MEENEQPIENSQKSVPRIIFDGFRVVSHRDFEDGEETSRISVGITAYESDRILTVDYWGGNDPSFEYIGEIRTDDSDGIIRFQTSFADYWVRDINQEDGLWMSRYGIPLPVRVLKENLKPYPGWHPDNPDAYHEVESLWAYVLAGSQDISFALYDNKQGQYVRISGTWFPITEPLPNLEEHIVVPIHPNFGNDFLRAYDNSALTLADIKPFEETQDSTN